MSFPTELMKCYDSQIELMVVKRSECNNVGESGVAKGENSNF